MTGIFIYGLVHPNESFDSRNIRYVGKSRNPLRRLREHMNESKRPKTNLLFYKWVAGIRESGLSPRLMVLEECDEDDWEEKERYWIKKLYDEHGLFNINPGGGGLPFGFSHSEETRRRISQSNKGHVVTEETRRKISMKNKGTKRTEVEKERNRQFHLGLKMPDETRRKISLTLKSHPVEEQTRKKISEGMVSVWKNRKHENL